MQLKKFFLPGILGDGLALLAGALLVLAFAPFGIFPLAVLCPAILLAVWEKVSIKRAFYRGFLFGIGLFGCGVYWVFISIHTFGNTSAAVAIFITSLFVAILALFPAFTGLLLNRSFPKANFPRVFFAFPAIWVFLEWIRSFLFSGFPWLFIGYSQASSPLKGYAPILSVYGVSLMVIISSTLFYLAGKSLYQRKLPAFYASLVGLAIIWLAGWGLSTIKWTQPIGEPIKVSLVQGNIEQNLKWSPDELQPTLDRYLELTQKSWGSQWIIWPEAAIPIPLEYAKDYVDNLNQLARDHHATVILGVPVRAGRTESYYNSIIAVGEGKGAYVKQRLVPFGEFIPLRKVASKFFDFMHIPMSDFVPGNPNTKSFEIGSLKIVPFICYEIAYPEQVLRYESDVNVLLTISNDAWFDGSIAQAQHLEMAQMRALEMQRPVLFVANTGITAIIAANGKIQSAAPENTVFVLTDKVQPTVGKTPLQYFSLDPLLILLFLFLFLGFRFRKD